MMVRAYKKNEEKIAKEDDGNQKEVEVKHNQKNTRIDGLRLTGSK